MNSYIAASAYLDWQHPAVLAQARALADGTTDQVAIAKRAFEFVRDEIKHSWDYKLNPTTCKASDVLAHGTGYCYAKSHLLAALLRANRIPAGLCYQRLAVDDEGTNFCLHGLNAIYLDDIGWYRVDARGNKAGVTATFQPPVERLAFTLTIKGEADLPEIWPEPLPIVIETIERYPTCQAVAENLPDLPLINLA